MGERGEFEKQIRRYVKERPEVVKEVEDFREELLSNFDDALKTAESGIENTIIGTEFEPEVYPVASPHAHMSKEKQDEMLIAISSAFLEQSHRDFSKKPLYEILKELEHKNGFEDLTAQACEKIYKEMESGRDILNPDERRYWAASYEAEENIVLLNELPKEILPTYENTPKILRPLTKGLNTEKDYNLNRNHNWHKNSLYITIVHEMTHAFLSVQLKNKIGEDPMLNGNKTLQALDEAVAGMTTYVFTGNFPTSNYSDAGINQKQLENFRDMYRKYCDKIKDEYSDKEIVSKMRAHAFFTAQSIISGTDPEKAFQEELRH